MTAPQFRGEPVRIVRHLIGNRVDPNLEREQRLYAEDPSAFWNRPDGDYLTDEPYVPVTRFYDARCDWTVEVSYL